MLILLFFVIFFCRQIYSIQMKLQIISKACKHTVLLSFINIAIYLYQKLQICFSFNKINGKCCHITCIYYLLHVLRFKWSLYCTVNRHTVYPFFSCWIPVMNLYQQQIPLFPTVSLRLLTYWLFRTASGTVWSVASFYATGGLLYGRYWWLKIYLSVLVSCVPPSLCLQQKRQVVIDRTDLKSK